MILISRISIGNIARFLSQHFTRALQPSQILSSFYTLSYFPIFVLLFVLVVGSSTFERQAQGSLIGEQNVIASLGGDQVNFYNTDGSGYIGRWEPGSPSVTPTSSVSAFTYDPVAGDIYAATDQGLWRYQGSTGTEALLGSLPNDNFSQVQFLSAIVSHAEIAAIPEPSTMSLFFLGLLGLRLRCIRRCSAV